MTVVLEKYIEQSEETRGGKPCITGTRISVSDVVIWHLRMGQSVDEIAAQYNLSLSAVHGALSYYYDHKTNVDDEISSSYQSYMTNKQANRSLVQQKLQNRS